MTITVKSAYDYAADMVARGQEIRDENLTERLRAQTVQSFFTADDPHQFRLVLRGTPIDEVISAKMFYGIDTAARGWTAIVPRDPDTEAQNGRAELFMPYQYHRAEIYLGGALTCTGYQYGTKPKSSPKGRYTTLSGWSLSADPIDSSMFPPFEANEITLEERAKSLLEPFGIGVTWEGGTDKPFKRATANKGDKVMAHLLNLANQRKQLIMSKPDGDIVIHEVAKSAPVATLEEGTETFQEEEVD